MERLVQMMMITMTIIIASSITGVGGAVAGYSRGTEANEERDAYYTQLGINLTTLSHVERNSIEGEHAMEQLEELINKGVRCGHFPPSFSTMPQSIENKLSTASLASAGQNANG